MKDKRDYLILILGFIILIFILLKGCGNTPEKDEIKPSVVIKETHDTIRAKDTLYVFKTKFYPKWDSAVVVDTMYPLSVFQFERTYLDTLDDTNVTIFSNQKIIGMIKSSKTSYKLKVPLIINNTKEITITNIETKNPNFSLYTGLETGGNISGFNISPLVGITIKNKNVYYRYGILDKTHNIGVGVQLFKSKK